jgi:hypothetical protein
VFGNNNKKINALKVWVIKNPNHKTIIRSSLVLAKLAGK